MSSKLSGRYKRVGLGLTEPVLLDLVQDLVNGLTFMQSKNVTHCDLKPENVLYVLDNTRQSGYRFIIADFGGAEEIAVVNRRIQTNHYRCPENLLNKKNDIRACDFFSMGCIIYTAITGIFLYNLSLAYFVLAFSFAGLIWLYSGHHSTEVVLGYL